MGGGGGGGVERELLFLKWGGKREIKNIKKIDQKVAKKYFFGVSEINDLFININ